MRRIILAIAIFLSFNIYSVTAQIYPYFEDFDSSAPLANPTGWQCTSPGFLVYASHGVNGTQAMSKNMNASGLQADSATSPIVGPLTPASELSFDYRIMEAVNYPCCAYDPQGGDIIEFAAVSGPLSITLFAIDSTNHLPDTAWTHMSIPVGQLSGNSGSLRITLRRGSGDYFVDFDNFSVADISGVTEQNKITSKAIVYPNPSRNGTVLRLKNVETGIYKAVLSTSSGVVALRQEINVTDSQNALINSSQLNRGVYLLQLDGLRNNYMIKFVVND